MPLELWQPAYVGVGSNLGDPRERVLAAFAALANIPQTRVLLTSPLYGSRPLGPVVQPDFVNAAVGMVTRLASADLLRQLRAIETAFGRPARHQKWGPRVIDLDLLVFGREQQQQATLTLPHPGIVERNFVLYPLADIAPDLDIPGFGFVSELKRRVVSEGLQRLP